MISKLSFGDELNKEITGSSTITIFASFIDHAFFVEGLRALTVIFESMSTLVSVDFM